jgi:hypothetical protein
MRGRTMRGRKRQVPYCATLHGTVGQQPLLGREVQSSLPACPQRQQLPRADCC